jgi:hypothetical protein
MEGDRRLRRQPAASAQSALLRTIIETWERDNEWNE